MPFIKELAQAADAAVPVADQPLAQAAAPRTSAFTAPAGGLPPLAELLAAARVVELPMKYTFRGIDRREAVLFSGPANWSEYSPFLEYRDTARWLAAAIEYGWHWQNSPGRLTVATNALLPTVAPSKVATVLGKTPGVKCVKIKVGGQDDLPLIMAACEYIGEEIELRLDVNGLWSPEQTLSFLDNLAAHGIDRQIDYLEQPCKTLAELSRLRILLAKRDLPIKIAADESLRWGEDPQQVCQVADVLVVKAQPLGGITAVKNITASCPIVVSSALETSVGLAMGVDLAAEMMPPRLPAGLATASLLAADITADPLLPDRNGRISRRRITPDQQLLNKYAAGRDRVVWWHERIREAYAALEESLAVSREIYG